MAGCVLVKKRYMRVGGRCPFFRGFNKVKGKENQSRRGMEKRRRTVEKRSCRTDHVAQHWTRHRKIFHSSMDTLRVITVRSLFGWWTIQKSRGGRVRHHQLLFGDARRWGRRCQSQGGACTSRQGTIRVVQQSIHVAVVVCVGATLATDNENKTGKKTSRKVVREGSSACV